MNLFVGNKLTENQFQLSEEEAHHCIRVCRYKIGDDVLISNFNGKIYKARILKADPDSVIVETTAVFKEESTDHPKIIIAISPTQASDRFEWFVEKAVENGVHGIIPLHCKRTENLKIKYDRLNKIILSSAKQTYRPLFPILHELCKLESLFEMHPGYHQKFIGHCQDGLEDYLGKKYNPSSDVMVLIGPAGDFTSQEIEFAIANATIPVSLGPYRLRTETAGLTALQILQTIRQLEL